MRRTLALILALLLLAGLAAAGILVLVGQGDALDRRGLRAAVSLGPFAVPEGFDVDPAVISDELVARMQARVDTDLALGLLLGEEEVAILRDQAIPRIVNAGVLRRMLEEMEGLGTVIEVAGVRALAEVEVANRGPAPLADVSLTMPAATRAEGLAGPAPALRVHEGDLASVTLPALAAGEVARLRLWLALPPAEVAARGREVRLGAAGGVEGSVRLYAAMTGWSGADLQVRPLARWIIAGLLALVAVGAVGVMGLALRPARRA